MSTRSIIIFIGTETYSSEQFKATRLYHHCDGYPTNMLPRLKDTLQKAKKMAKEKAEQFKRPDPITYPADMLTGIFVGETTTAYGMGARIEQSVTLDSPHPADWDEKTSREVLGNQGDLEWVYVVHCTDNREIAVYGGGYCGDAPFDFMARDGRVDPLSYVERLIDECQEEEKATIEAALRALKRLGWPVNPNGV